MSDWLRTHHRAVYVTLSTSLPYCLLTPPLTIKLYAIYESAARGGAASTPLDAVYAHHQPLTMGL